MSKLIKSIFAAVILLTDLSGRGRDHATPASEFCTAAPAKDSAEKVLRENTSGLVWEKSEIELQATFGQKIVRTVYHFTNLGSVPVSFLDLVPSCGCVATQIDKLIYGPGETGEVKVTLDLEMDEGEGLQDRTILVTTNVAPKAATLLRLVVHVPTAIETSPKALTWTSGEAPVTKEVAIQGSPGVSAMKLYLEGENTDFSTVVVPVIEGKSYQVRVTPTQTSTPSFAQIRLRAESGAFPRPIDCKINVYVK